MANQKSRANTDHKIKINLEVDAQEDVTPLEGGGCAIAVAASA
jgi:hypothetical protein